MVKHIVLFKLKDEVPAEEKLIVMTKFKEAIEALPAKISVIPVSYTHLTLPTNSLV